MEAAVSSRLPKWLRVLILAATALVFTAVFGIISLLAAGALSHTPLMSLLLFVLDAGLAALGVYKARQALRPRSRE